MSLYGARGRKYLNRIERARALAAMDRLPPDQRLFGLTLAWSGARISEVRSLTSASLQLETGIIAIVTLKRRCHVVREVPIPPWLMAALDAHFQIAARQRDPKLASVLLFPWGRTKAWSIIKRVTHWAGIYGPHASPKAFRHAFGIEALGSGVPLTLLKVWLGHARIETTAIYATPAGSEAFAYAEKLWRAQGICS